MYMMHPSISELLAQANVRYEVLLYRSFPGVQGLRDLVRAEGFSPKRIAKAILWEGCNSQNRLGIYCLAVGPIHKRQNLDAMVTLLNDGRPEDAPEVRRLRLATEGAVQELLGQPVDSVSPLAYTNPRILRVFMDESLLNFQTIVISAGASGTALRMNPNDIARLTHALVLPLDAPPEDDRRR